MDEVARSPGEQDGRSRANIRMVAEQAGVSVATASYALNGGGRVSTATRARVNRVAEQLNYRPNPHAQLMRSGRSGIIGISEQLAPGSSWQWDDLEFVVRLIRACCSAAWAEGLYPVLLPVGVDQRSLEALPLDGVIVIDPLPEDPQLRQLQSLNVPAVTMGRDIAADPATGWWADNDKTAQCERLLEHFHALGARHIMMLSSETGQSYMVDNVRAFRAWTAKHGVRAQVHEVPPSFSREECYSLVKQACTGTEPIDAIYVVVEALVQPTLDAILDSGLSVPDDVKMATSSESSVTRSLRVPLTTFDLAPEALGQALVELLTTRIAGATSPQTRTVDTELIIRESSRPATP